MSENRYVTTDQPSQTRPDCRTDTYAPWSAISKKFGETGNRVPAFIVKHVSR